MIPSEAVKFWRLKRGYTTAQVAEKAGCSIRTIQKIEAGDIKPSVFDSVCNILRIPRSDIDFPKKK